MRTIRANWYEYPHLYDIAFGWDPGVEVDFVLEAAARFAAGPVRTCYEPFCGTGRIAIELARRGLAVEAIDLVPAAVDFARDRAARVGVSVRWEVGDAGAWRPVGRIDVLPILIDSFRHASAPGAAEAAVGQFARAVRPGGLLILGLDVGDRPPEVTDEESWVMERDGVTIETAVFDTREPGPAAGTTIVRAVLAVTGDGSPYTLVTDDVMRTYTRASLLDLVTGGGQFETCGVFDRRYDLDKPVHPNSRQADVVCVFRRTSK